MDKIIFLLFFVFSFTAKAVYVDQVTIKNPVSSPANVRLVDVKGGNGIYADPFNSTTTTLAASSTYYGKWRDWASEGFVSLQINLTASHNGTICIDFSDNATVVENSDVSIDIPTCANYLPSIGTLSGYSPFRLKWVRVRYINSSIPQTSFSISSNFLNHAAPLGMIPLFALPTDYSLAGLVRAVPAGKDEAGTYHNQAFTRTGNSKVSIGAPDSDDDALITQGGALNTEQKYHLIGSFFEESAVNTSVWSVSTSGGATVSATAPGGFLAVTGASSSSVIVTSVEKARFAASSINQAQLHLKLSDGASGTANNIKLWGAFNDSAGFFFKQNGTSGLQVGYRSNGVDTVVNEADFNGPVDPVKDTNYHVWVIRYGPAKTEFFQDNELIHTITASASLTSSSMHLPIRAQNTNSATTTASTIYAGYGLIFRIGREASAPRYKYISTDVTNYVLKAVPSRILGVLSSRSATGIGAVSSLEVHDSASGTSSGTLIMPIYTNAAGTNPIPLDIETSNGITINTTGTDKTQFLLIYN